MEGYANAGTLNGSAGNSSPVGGRRHRGKSHKKSHKKSHHLRAVTKKVARHHLKKLGLKMRGGMEEGGGSSMAAAPPAGGRRHRKRSHKKGLLGGMGLY
jgi:hypothetical protein